MQGQATHGAGALAEIEALFQSALERPPAERAAFLGPGPGG
jgi:hypothetical protein